LENLHFDPIRNEIKWTHTLAFGAKSSSLDTPTLRQIQNMLPPEIDGWYNAMDAEIEALHAKDTMIEISRCQVPPGGIEIASIASQEQLADIFTKALPPLVLNVGERNFWDGNIQNFKAFIYYALASGEL
jgi:hypothetical protein